MPTLVVIERPTESVPTLEEVKAHLRQDFIDDDDDIQAKIWGAIAEFEDPELGWLGRSILPRLVELRRDTFCDCMPLPGGPLLPDPPAELIIVYDDAAGAEQTLAGAVYRVLDPETGDCRVVLKKGQSWPTTSGEEQSIRVRYWAGYEADDNRVENFKSAVKLHVEMIYDGNTEAKERLAETIDRLLQPYRIYR